MALTASCRATDLPTIAGTGRALMRPRCGISDPLRTIDGASHQWPRYSMLRRASISSASGKRTRWASCSSTRIPMLDRRSVGQRGEDIAAEYLRKNGYRVLQRNVRSRYGEIDIVAAFGDCLVFVE